MTVQIQSLRSGSSGNALLIRADSVTLLVDCGLPPRELRAMLTAVDCGVEDVDLVLLSHEHGDHTRGLPVLLAAGCQVVATAGTARAVGLPAGSPLIIHDDQVVEHEAGAGAVRIHLLPVLHDAVEPCGFGIDVEGVRCTLFTDLGTPALEHSAHLGESDLIVIEANHDVSRLRDGPYPARLKQRVASPRGHLSNQASGHWLAAALKGSRHAPDIWLAHLSHVNNAPALARETVEKELRDSGVRATVTPLPRRTLGPLWDVPKAREPLPDPPLQLALSLP